MDQTTMALMVQLAYESEDRTAVMVDADGTMWIGQGRSDGIVDVEYLDLDTGFGGMGTIT